MQVGELSIEVVVKKFSSIVKNQLDNDSIFKLVKKGYNVHELEKLGVREISMVVCVRNGMYEFLTTEGSFGFVDDKDLINTCISKGGEPYIIIHNHPGGLAIPSAGDFRDLLGLYDENKLPEWYCVARTGKKYVFTTCFKVPKDREKIEYLSGLSAEELTTWLGIQYNEYVEIELNHETTSVYKSSTAKFVEEKFVKFMKDEDVEIKYFKIPKE